VESGVDCGLCAIFLLPCSPAHGGRGHAPHGGQEQLLVFSLWSNWYRQGGGKYNGIWERIFVDFPMLIGLGLVGVALKMQNDEHDELVQLATLLLLVAGGLLQHISNLVKVVYDIVCSRFEPELLNALNMGKEYVV